MSAKQPTIKEIAKRLNISISTVSRALHDHSSIGLRTKTRVKELAKELKYEPNQAAIFFQQRKTFTIGVILPFLSELFFSSAISGIEDVAVKSQYTVLLGQSRDDANREKHIIETMKKHRVDGIIISISKHTTNYEHFNRLRQSGIPVVFFDCIPNMTDIHYVACNMVSGTVQATSFLLKNGHRVIGLINGPEKLYASKQRQEGYQIAMSKHRLKYDPSLIVNSDLTKEGSRKAVKELLEHKRKVTAIVTFNDYVALDAMQYADAQHVAINKDVCFVSYSNLPMVEYLKYSPMASVEQNPYLQGQKATEMLLELLQKKEEDQTDNSSYKIIIDSHLVEYKQ